MVDVHHLDVFARAPGGGNPCPIVIDADGLGSEQMQAIAAHYGEETGFVLDDAAGALRFRYFVPRHEMSMCVHATVAAITVLVDERRLAPSPIVVRTGSGDCIVTYNAEAPPLVTVEQQRPEFGVPFDVPRERLAHALGVPGAAIDERLPVRAVSVSRPKLIVALRDAAAVHAATPDLPALWDLCRAVEATGAYLFAPHPDGRPDHVVARQFPVDAGFPEDPATGVAAGALAAYLAQSQGWNDIEIDQGDAMGRPSALRASAFVDAERVRRSTVTGRAALHRREQLDLDDLAPI